jgi:uncharacterized protein GlcG (DUF336 family)
MSIRTAKWLIPGELKKAGISVVAPLMYAVAFFGDAIRRRMEVTMRRLLITAAVAVGGALGFGLLTLDTPLNSAVRADDRETLECPVRHGALRSALIAADAADSTGLDNHYWAVVVNRDGRVCAVAFSGDRRDDQWLLSRQIAAAKAFTANGLSLDGAPLSTAQLYPWVQPGAPANPLFGLAAGNPVSPEDAYQGPASQFGTRSDPMVGKRVGGTITFGGGLGLYAGAAAIGGVGLSGDTACADHSTAWRLRALLNLAPTSGNDRITLDNAAGHPHCPNDAATQGRN